MLDPVQLIHCGHHFSQAAIANSYYEKLEKVCPIGTCGQTYLVTLKNDFLKKITGKFIETISQPNSELTNEIHALYQALPDSEDKKKIHQGIELFIKGKRNGIKIVSDVSISSVKGKEYTSIFKLMKTYNDNISNQINNLIQKKNDAKTIESSQVQPVSTDITGNGAIQPPSSEINDTNITKEIISNDHQLERRSKKRDKENDIDQDRTIKYPRLDNDNRIDEEKSINNETIVEPEAIEQEKGHSLQMPQANNEDRMRMSPGATNENMKANAVSWKNVLFEAIHKNVKDMKTLNHHIQCVDPNDQDEQRQTALHLIVEKYAETEIENMLEKLYENGANLDAKNSGGETALHIAVKMDKIKTIQKLRQLGASIEIVNREKNTPLDIAKSDEAKQALMSALNKGRRS